jgi:hypothetical protein
MVSTPTRGRLRNPPRRYLESQCYKVRCFVAPGHDFGVVARKQEREVGVVQYPLPS